MSQSSYTTTGEQHILTPKGLYTLEYLYENYSSIDLESFHNLQIEKMKKQKPFTLSLGAHILPCTLGSTIYSNTENDGVYKARKVDSLAYDGEGDLPDIILALAPPKRFKFPDSPEYPYEETMGRIEDRVVDMNVLLQWQNDDKLSYPSDTAILCTDPKEIWQLGNFMSAHGVDIAFHPHRPLIFLGARKGACFAKALLDGARFNISDYFARLSARGIVVPANPPSQKDIEEMVETGLILEAPIPQRKMPIGFISSPKDPEFSLTMYRITSSDRIVTSWLEI